jgi:hypothetical protein
VSCASIYIRKLESVSSDWEVNVEKANGKRKRLWAKN